MGWVEISHSENTDLLLRFLFLFGCSFLQVNLYIQKSSGFIRVCCGGIIGRCVVVVPVVRPLEFLYNRHLESTPQLLAVFAVFKCCPGVLYLHLFKIFFTCFCN